MWICYHVSCTKRGNVSKFPKPGRYETGPQKMETSGEMPYIYKKTYIYIYIYGNVGGIYIYIMEMSGDNIYIYIIYTVFPPTFPFFEGLFRTIPVSET
jgi:hypothetical protein